MLMRIRIAVCVVLLVFCLATPGISGEVGLDTARVVAQNWLVYHIDAYGSWADSRSPEIAEEEVMTHAGQVVGYNFLISPMGHIVVPFRNELPVVKLYSETITLSMAQDSDVTEWVKEIELFQIYEQLDEHAQEFAKLDGTSSPNAQLWELFTREEGPVSQEYEKATETTEFLSLGPLLATSWGQSDPYNLQTPAWYTGDKTVTGCVATAAAQIMRYWKYPTTGQNFTSYTWNNGSYNVTLSRDFSSRTYDWANMSATYGSSSTTTQKNAVAKLLADVGIAFHMDYGRSADGGSGASTSYAVTVFPTYFNYKDTIQRVYRSSYASDSAWMQVFKTEVQAGRPCQFRASDDGGAGGHSVVVDGYRDSPAQQIHINLGWNGYYDGWYVSNNIAAWNYDFNTGQAAVIGIEPAVTTASSFLLWTK